MGKAKEWNITTSNVVLGKKKEVPRKPWLTNKIFFALKKKIDHIGYKIIKNQITDKY